MRTWATFARKHARPLSPAALRSRIQLLRRRIRLEALINERQDAELAQARARIADLDLRQRDLERQILDLWQTLAAGPPPPF